MTDSLVRSSDTQTASKTEMTIVREVNAVNHKCTCERGEEVMSLTSRITIVKEYQKNVSLTIRILKKYQYLEEV